MDSCKSEEEHTKKWRMCVVGAGPAGLATAKELSQEGHGVVVYEQCPDVGGIWLYNDKTNSDLMEAGNVHSSAYNCLRLRIPRETMEFQEFPFKVVSDPRRYPQHHEHLRYLQAYAQHFGLIPMICFNTRVQHICMTNEVIDHHLQQEKIKWQVETLDLDTQVVSRQIFDGVVICSGHHTQPKVSTILGLKTWPGKQIHSHSYKIPDPFIDQVVVVIGNGDSGRDICIDLLKVAKEVHLSAKPQSMCDAIKKLKSHYSKFFIHSVVESLDANGLVHFEGGATVFAHSIIHCTGYSYSFPFLDTKDIVNVEDVRVGPLFEHMFPPLLAPSLSFVGIPRKVLTNPFFESQARWISLVLCGKRKLPSTLDMLKSVEDHYKDMEAKGVPKCLTHEIGNFEYFDKIADYSGYPCLEEWKQESITQAIVSSYMDYEAFRDSPSD